MFNTETGALLVKKWKPFIRRKNYVYLNENQGFEFYPRKSFISIVVGRTGTGKTYLTGLISTQFLNVIYLDPTAGGAFRKTLGEIGVRDKWKFWRFSKNKGKDTLKFNICDCGERVVDAIFYRIPKNDRERQRKNAFAKFFAQPREFKSWNNFVHLCEENKLEGYLPDFEMLFDKKDGGVSIDFIQKGRNVVEIENIGIQTLSMGIFFAMLIENRGNNPNLKYFGADFLLVCIDEAQTFAKFGTSLGNSFAEMAEQCRKFGIGLLASGSVYKGAQSGLHPSIRQQKTFSFVFKTEGSIQAYKGENLDLIEDDINDLAQFQCYFFNSFTGANRVRIVGNNFFLDVERLVKENVQQKVVVQLVVSRNDIEKLCLGKLI